MSIGERTRHIMRSGKHVFALAPRFPFVFVLAVLLGCAHSEPQSPSYDDLLDSVLRTDIRSWPAPGPASGATASAIGKLNVNAPHRVGATWCPPAARQRSRVTSVNDPNETPNASPLAHR